MRKIMLFILAALPLAVLYINTAPASKDIQQEITTAITNANNAKKTKYVKQVHLYLHHVVNCLVGTRSADFDANAGDPCIGAGQGAINDYTGGEFNKLLLTRALQDAKYGLISNNIQIARNAADLSKKDLQDARRAL